jgi:hypothetical protein
MNAGCPTPAVAPRAPQPTDTAAHNARKIRFIVTKSKERGRPVGKEAVIGYLIRPEGTEGMFRNEAVVDQRLIGVMD